MKEGTNNKHLDTIYLPAQEELENLGFVAVNPRIRELRAFVYDVMSKRSYAINFSSQIFPLYAVKKGE